MTRSTDSSPPTDRGAKSIYFVSLGCPKNRVDTEVMVGVAAESGYVVTTEAEDADAIVVNTCGFIGEAKKESIETILELAELRKSGRAEKLIVTGCLSQRYSGELEEGMPEVDHFLGSSDMLRLKDALGPGADRMLVGTPADWVVRASDPRVVTGSAVSAYVKLAEGCNRSCAFCTIPQFRGKQRSRHPDDIVREVERLADAGTREVCLISQDTVSYGRDIPKDERTALADVVRRVADVPGIEWVRLFYLYPERLDDALIELLAQHPHVLPYVDMPLQHADDAMLKIMKRGHGIDRQKRCVETLHARVPDLTFRTAFIVGHPGETDASFKSLVDFVEWAKFDYVGVFRYSDEETAASHALPGKVPPLVIANRARRLTAVAKRIATKKNRARLGTTVRVLCEGPSPDHELVMAGRHGGQAPEIDGQVYLSGGEVAVGALTRVRLSDVSGYDFVGEVIEADAAPHARPQRRHLPLAR